MPFSGIRDLGTLGEGKPVSLAARLTRGHTSYVQAFWMAFMVSITCLIPCLGAVDSEKAFPALKDFLKLNPSEYEVTFSVTADRTEEREKAIAEINRKLPFKLT